MMQDGGISITEFHGIECLHYSRSDDVKHVIKFQVLQRWEIRDVESRN